VPEWTNLYQSAEGAQVEILNSEKNLFDVK